jgi:hypothetical protein
MTYPRFSADDAGSARSGPFVPLLLICLAMVGWLAFQSWLLLREQQQLGLAQTTLEPQEQAAGKLRSSLDAVATATARLAAEGNANARVIVDELRKRGVTINPTAAPKPP